MIIQTALKTVLTASILYLAMLAPLKAQEWILTPETYVGFELKSIGMFRVAGQFEQLQSSMSFDATVPQQATAQLVLNPNSISLNRPALKNMILGQDFFWVEKYPTAIFRGHDFSALGDHQYMIKGELTLRGITRPVTLATRLKPNTVHPEVLDVQAHTVINRSDFGMKPTFAGIGEKVNIMVAGQWQAK